MLTGLAKSACHEDSSPLFGVADETAEARRQVSKEILGNEPNYEQEPRNECGLSFETELFGGSLITSFGGTRLLYKHYDMIPLELGLTEWPSSQVHYKTRILLDAALSMEDLVALVPTDKFTKFYDQSFWDHYFAQYNHQTLKLSGTITGL